MPQIQFEPASSWTHTNRYPSNLPVRHSTVKSRTDCLSPVVTASTTMVGLAVLRLPIYAANTTLLVVLVFMYSIFSICSALDAASKPLQPNTIFRPTTTGYTLNCFARLPPMCWLEPLSLPPNRTR